MLELKLNEASLKEKSTWEKQFQSDEKEIITMLYLAVTLTGIDGQ